jgi:hypothetical protein
MKLEVEFKNGDFAEATYDLSDSNSIRFISESLIVKDSVQLYIVADSKNLIKLNTGVVRFETNGKIVHTQVAKTEDLHILGVNISEIKYIKVKSEEK